MPNNLEIKSLCVEQGNGNGQSIDFDVDLILRTEDMWDCISIVIKDDNQKKLSLIHSDTPDDRGIGSIPLEMGFRRLGLLKETAYEIRLYGGRSLTTLENEKKIIKHLLPNATVIFMKPNVNNLYLFSNGLAFESQKEIRKAFNVETVSIKDQVSTNLHTKRW